MLPISHSKTTMADIKPSIDNLNYKMENNLSKTQDLDTYPDVTKFHLEEMELCSTSSPKGFAKFLKIPSLLYDTEKNSLWTLI